MQKRDPILKVCMDQCQKDTLYADLSLPATWAEIQDAKERCGVTQPAIPYRTEVMESNPDYLREHLTQRNATIEQLNTLALGIAGLENEELPILEGLLQMARRDESITWDDPVSTVIQLIDNVDGHVTVPAVNHYDLGQFLYANGMFEHLPEGVEKLGVSPYLDYAAMAKDAIKSGDLTGEWVKGYFFIPLDDIHLRDEASLVLPSRPPYAFSVELQDQGGCAVRELVLPMPQRELKQILEGMGDALCEMDCRVSESSIVLNIPLHAEDLADWNQAAGWIAGMMPGELCKLKAMAHAMHPRGPADLLELIQCMEDFKPLGEQLNEEAYALAYIRRHLPQPEVFETAIRSLYNFGQTAAKVENVALTPYGALRRVDGGPIEAMGACPPQDMRLT